MLGYHKSQKFKLLESKSNYNIMAIQHFNIVIRAGINHDLVQLCRLVLMVCFAVQFQMTMLSRYMM